MARRTGRHGPGNSPGSDRALIRELSATLHAGEAAAIALAAEITGAVLVIDESDGRLAAARIGLRFTGTVGVLIAAKRAGHVPALAPLLDALRTRARFWLNDEVVRRALALAGE